MVEEPNFEYNYDLAYQKSFAARLSFRIMTIAATVFLVAVILFFYFTEDGMTLPLTHQIVKYGMVVFIVGLALLFIFCTIAIYQMVKPLKMFTESVVSIAEGNLDTPLPEVHSQDELLQLRNAFEYMQTCAAKRGKEHPVYPARQNTSAMKAGSLIDMFYFFIHL